MQERLFGLIGYPVSHSFSKKYFSDKFLKEGFVGCSYELFPLPDLSELPGVLSLHPRLEGLNVTIPHKENIIPYLDELEEEAGRVGAVNTISIKNGKLKGYNTDVYGFEKSLADRLVLLQPDGIQALVLGTGGASKAVKFVLEKWSVPFQFVSRNRQPGVLAYEDVTAAILNEHRLIINTTPLGMHPAVDICPELPYEGAGESHLFYDLVYNPEETLFLKKAAARGAHACSGLAMLYLQAERAWEIWNEDL